jgi:hypothetical protein
MTEFSDLIPGPGERNVIYGTTGSGKSCHVDWEMRSIQATRPDAMQALIDSKPRFRAETERGKYNPKARKSAAWRYRNWTSGPVIPNSVLVDIWDDHPFRGLWSRPGEIAIMQSGDSAEWDRILKLLMKFVKANVGDRERRIVADEVLDFYGRTTWSINAKNDVFYLASRAGRERLVGLSLGAQRVHGLPIMVRNMASRVTLYHLDEEKDMKYLASNGIQDVKSPSGDFIFRQWTKQKGGTMGNPLTGRLNLPDSYLEQLSAA